MNTNLDTSDKINLAEWKNVKTSHLFPAVIVREDVLQALIGAVEAVHDYLYHHGDEAHLHATLARFDFGEQS
jgi:hypothetical protein